MPISPDMLSPATLPVKASVSGIGLVMEIFQATSSPETVPSKISPELPSAPCVPVSVPPALVTLSVALRSPIGVLIVIFQFPSTAISGLPTFPGQPKWGRDCQTRRRYSLSLSPCPMVRSWLVLPNSGAGGGANAAADQEAE